MTGTPTRRAGLAAALGAPPLALAQAFPSRPLRPAIPFAAGGPADASARMLAETIGAGNGRRIQVIDAAGIRAA
jgi:tripartite-type tricarboxylate transporter receptor subunit TctC